MFSQTDSAGERWKVFLARASMVDQQFRLDEGDGRLQSTRCDDMKHRAGLTRREALSGVSGGPVAALVSPTEDDNIGSTADEDVPVTIPSVIAAVVVAFDTGRHTPRRYLLRALALLRGKRRARTGADSVRRPQSRGGLVAWPLPFTCFLLAGRAPRLEAVLNALQAKTPVGRSTPDTVGTPLHPVSVGGTPP
jgi:hypothetical protein